MNSNLKLNKIKELKVTGWCETQFKGLPCPVQKIRTAKVDKVYGTSLAIQ